MSATQRLDEVFGLPEGSEVYVLNDFKSSAYDAVRLFETLGLNQFRYIPFYPGAKDEGVARPLITFGEYDDQCHYLPRCIEKENFYNESLTESPICLKKEFRKAFYSRFPCDGKISFDFRLIGFILSIRAHIYHELVRNRKAGVAAVRNRIKSYIFDHPLRI